jgi:carbon monoxide dehydrogenase subunit G
MQIDNEFTVSVPIDRAWEVLTDLEGIAPCLPGAQLTGREGDDFKGQVKVKVGPVVATYQGAARFVEKDDVVHRAVIDAKGRDARGAGNASALITAQLEAKGEQTLVQISTDLKISGKVAQFGRNVIEEVSTKLLGQFVECLDTKLVAAPVPSGAPPEPAPAEPSVGAGAPEGVAEPVPATTAPPAPAEAEPLDLMALAGGAMAKRLVPLAMVAIVIIVVVVLLVG